MNTGRNSSLDVTGQKGKKQKKYLAKSKKSTNSQSAKAIPLGIQATRFSDPSYYHNS